MEQHDLKKSQNIALNYMAVIANIARESFIILDPDLRVITANPIFYKVFCVTPEQTENKLLYDLGNGQWDIPELKKILEEILPQKKIVQDYEVTHNFEKIGQKTMLLNARQIDTEQLIIIAIEDYTVKKILENKLALNAKELTAKVVEQTKNLNQRILELEAMNKSMVDRELKMVELKKEIEALKKNNE